LLCNSKVLKKWWSEVSFTLLIVWHVLFCVFCTVDFQFGWWSPLLLDCVVIFLTYPSQEYWWMLWLVSNNR
jgi:hypothetical protein